jgi:hypothetical protein
MTKVIASGDVNEISDVVEISASEEVMGLDVARIMAKTATISIMISWARFMERLR